MTLLGRIISKASSKSEMLQPLISETLTSETRRPSSRNGISDASRQRALISEPEEHSVRRANSDKPDADRAHFTSVFFSVTFFKKCSLSSSVSVWEPNVDSPV